MAKKGRDQQKHVASKHVTTRRLARWQREKRRQRITFLSGVVIIVIVLGIIVGGVTATRSSDWLSKVQTVSGTITIKKADYANDLKLFQIGIYNSSTMTNESPLKTIEDGYLVKDKAKEVGIDASETEIDNAILAFFGVANKSFSDTDFQQAYQNTLGNFSISNKDFRDNIQVQILGPKLLSYYINQTPASGEQAAVETIIVFNESDANELTERWRSGEDFTTLSAAYGNNSQSGWLPKGYAGGEFDNVAFTIEIGNISDPIPIGNISDATSSSDGYYVLKVLERKDDVISDSMRQAWGYNEYETWYQQAYATKVERNPDLNLAELYAWAVKQLS
jgi:parvulin-like peptidyl-prolyl isomerase